MFTETEKQMYSKLKKQLKNNQQHTQIAEENESNRLESESPSFSHFKSMSPLNEQNTDEGQLNFSENVTSFPQLFSSENTNKLRTDQNQRKLSYGINKK